MSEEIRKAKHHFGQTVIGVKEDDVMGVVNCQTGYININFYIERKGGIEE